DIAEFETIKTRCEAKGLNVLSYGEQGEDITLLNIVPQPNGQIIAFEMNQVRYKILVPLVGSFQAYNVMATLGILSALDVNIDVVVGKLTGLKSVPGRMERVGNHPKKAGIYVDYAHSPDALEKALKALRPHTHCKLYVVFGCGGDRDRGKRKLMGAVAAEYADHVIVTDDNTRTEDAASIRAEVMQGCIEAENIGDRYAAIQHAVSLLKEGDTLLIAGKGHEDYQIIGKQKLHFDDRVKACEAIAAVEETV
ncbi:MAG: UDP-N-acetylmuramoyl-L-alanyl-D-glutamate--2,6-diaminopimelate ligase, partial [Rickettsiales bacterium]|nr:UDP-N-acetylmuramoyl-L-alanyl-D-glutamate--2,6-diaminopimelate ligase [Rickettsiales bacterium]